MCKLQLLLTMLLLMLPLAVKGSFHPRWRKSWPGPSDTSQDLQTPFGGQGDSVNRGLKHRRPLSINEVAVHQWIPPRSFASLPGSSLPGTNAHREYSDSSTIYMTCESSSFDESYNE